MTAPGARINTGPEMPKYLVVQNPDDVADTMSTLQLATNTTPPDPLRQLILRQERLRQERLNELTRRLNVLRSQYQHYNNTTEEMVRHLESLERPVLSTRQFRASRVPRQAHMQQLITLEQQNLELEQERLNDIEAGLIPQPIIHESAGPIIHESVEVESRHEELRDLGYHI